MCLVSIILSILLLYPYTFAVYEQLDLFLSLYKYMSLYLLIPYICGANSRHAKRERETLLYSVFSLLYYLAIRIVQQYSCTYLARQDPTTRGLLA